MERSAKAARTGRYGIVCTGVKRGGPSQKLPIKPGRYVGVVFVRVPAAIKGKPTIQIALIPRNAKNQDLPASFTTTIHPRSKNWRPITVVADVPAKVQDQEVAKARFMILLEEFQPGEQVHIDDAMLYRLDDRQN